MSHELLAQIALEEHHIAQAGYCAIRALDKGQQMAVLTPVVARSYALLLQVCKNLLNLLKMYLNPLGAPGVIRSYAIAYYELLN